MHTNGHIFLLSIMFVHSNAHCSAPESEICHKITSSQNVHIALKAKQLSMQSETNYMQSETRFGQQAD